MNHEQEDCNPRAAKPGELCTVPNSSHPSTEQSAVLVCNHGKYCDDELCLTVCEKAWEFYLFHIDKEEPTNDN